MTITESIRRTLHRRRRRRLARLVRRYGALGLAVLVATGALPPAPLAPPPDLPDSARALLAPVQHRRLADVRAARESVVPDAAIVHELLEAGDVLGLAAAMTAYPDTLARAVAVDGGDAGEVYGSDLMRAMSLLAVLAGGAQFRTPSAAPPPAPTGDYSSAYRYVPRYTLPYTYDASGAQSGSLTYNAATGLVEGRVFDASYPTTFAVTELLADQGSAAANQALLQSRLDAHLATAGNVRLRLAVFDSGGMVKANWHAANVTTAITARSRTAAGVIVIESETVLGGTFPRAEDVRVQDGDEAHMAFFGYAGDIDSANGSPVFLLAPGASHIRFVGLEFGIDPGWTQPAVDAGSFVGARGFIYAGNADGNNPIGSGVDADYPYGITVERCSLHGALGKAWTRGLRINGKRIAVKDCRIRHIANLGQDCQCFLSQSGSGPYLIENNQLDAAYAENIMFGGGGSGAESELMSDMQIIDNAFEFPADWKALGTKTKNLLEFKEGRRALVQGNRFAGFDTLNGAYAAQYYALVIKTNVNDNGQPADTGSWLYGVTQDITVRLNDFSDCAGWLALQGRDIISNAPHQATHRVEVAHNRLNPFGDGTLRAYGDPGLHRFVVQYGGATATTDEALMLRYIAVHHNTIFGPYTTDGYQSPIQLASGRDAPWRYNAVEGNALILPAGAANKPAYLQADGAAALPAQTTWNTMTDRAGSTWGSNAVVGVTDSGHLIPTDAGYADLAAAGIDATTGAPLSGSPLLTGDSDGGRQGADIALLLTATARAATGL